MRTPILLVALLLAACDTTATDAPGDLSGVDVRALSHDSDALVGTWDLETSTTSGQVGTPTTGTASGETLVFREDGTLEIHRQRDTGEVAVVTVAYRVARVDYGDGTQSEVPALFFDDRPVPFGIDRGPTLYLDDRALDGDLRGFRKL